MCVTICGPGSGPVPYGRPGPTSMPGIPLECPLHHAALESRDCRLAPCLIQNGADLEARDACGRKPFDCRPPETGLPAELITPDAGIETLLPALGS